MSDRGIFNFKNASNCSLPMAVLGLPLDLQEVNVMSVEPPLMYTSSTPRPTISGLRRVQDTYDEGGVGKGRARKEI